MSTAAQPAAQPHLIRALGRRDLVLLFVVAVLNLNVVPSIAANGGVTVWLWIISLLLFFWPQRRPIYVAKAEDAWLEDVDGNRYVDFAGGIGCANAGHRQEAVVDAGSFRYTTWTLLL